MPFRGIVDPKDLALLRRVLDDHCAEFYIGADHLECETSAYLLVELFSAGFTDAEALRRHLRERMLKSGG